MLKNETMKANAAGDWRAPQIACLRLNLARHDGKTLRRFFVEAHAFKKCA
jgi:hypothetical protein